MYDVSDSIIFSFYRFFIQMLNLYLSLLFARITAHVSCKSDIGFQYLMRNPFSRFDFALDMFLIHEEKSLMGKRRM